MRAIDLAPPMVITAEASTSLAEAAKMMRLHAVGDLVITRFDGYSTKAIGVVTDRDIVVHAIACGLDPGEISVTDLCTREPAAVDADADLFEITAAMNEHGVRRVVVTRDSDLAGVISMDNVIEALADLLNHLSGMLAQQIDYEQEHLVTGKSQDNAA
jgi:CBS domain-containing protein